MRMTVNYGINEGLMMSYVHLCATVCRVIIIDRVTTLKYLSSTCSDTLLPNICVDSSGVDMGKGVDEPGVAIANCTHTHTRRYE